MEEVDTVLEVEREFTYPRDVLFRAFTEPAAFSQWFAPTGWHVVPESVELNPQLGGRIRHTKVRDDDPEKIWVVDGVYTEVFYPDVLVTRQRISGISGIDPSRPVELRVEFTRLGQGKTLLRIVQGPYTESAALDYSDGWESILDHLQTYLESSKDNKR
ncbi:SRPBCC family protein [Propionibacterium australiense]|nr:SRPBCC domain-containing protein [Propionibacterium australiense]SYZ32315.1 Activator of Hsp90 ATPase homologue 1-like [Propionibacterium australiense]VEH90456.1 Activator of Hsp90 ATPase homolog 1-like protein [Propionibacterium australiense]